MKSTGRYKTHTILISLLVVLALAFSLSASFGKTLDEINEEKEQKQEELEKGKEESEKLQQEMEAIKKDIEETQQSVSSMSSEIAVLQTRIDENQKELDKKKEDLQKSVDDLNIRLRNMYKNGTIGFVDVILSSENVVDLISNMDMVLHIYNSDKDLVTKLEEEVKKIEEMQAGLTAQKDELNLKLEELNALQEKLDSQFAQVESDKAAQDATNEELQEDLAALNRDAAQIQALINNSSANATEYTGTRANTGGSLEWPVPGSYMITSPYGYRSDPLGGFGDKHTGLDINAPTGHPIVAAENGSVIEAGPMGSYGNAVLISHGNGLYTLYAHNSSLLVSAGQTVDRGQTIALAGATGRVTGPHCHFEVRLGGGAWGNDVDPTPYLY